MPPRRKGAGGPVLEMGCWFLGVVTDQGPRRVRMAAAMTLHRAPRELAHNHAAELQQMLGKDVAIVRVVGGGSGCSGCKGMTDVGAADVEIFRQWPAGLSS